MCCYSQIKKYAYNNKGFFSVNNFYFFCLIILYMKERFFLAPSKWYYRTDSLIMGLVCYKYSVEGEEIPPSRRELHMEKFPGKFCEAAALCPQSRGDALRCTLLWARHGFCHILKLLEVPGYSVTRLFLEYELEKICFDYQLC